MSKKQDALDDGILCGGAELRRHAAGQRDAHHGGLSAAERLYCLGARLYSIFCRGRFFDSAIVTQNRRALLILAMAGGTRLSCPPLKSRPSPEAAPTRPARASGRSCSAQRNERAGNHRFAVPGDPAGPRRPYDAWREYLFHGDSRTVCLIRHLQALPEAEAGQKDGGFPRRGDRRPVYVLRHQLPAGARATKRQHRRSLTKFATIFAVTQIPLAIVEWDY